MPISDRIRSNAYALLSTVGRCSVSWYDAVINRNLSMQISGSVCITTSRSFATRSFILVPAHSCQYMILATQLRCSQTAGLASACGGLHSNERRATAAYLNNCVSMLTCSPGGRSRVATGRVLGHTIVVERRERMPRVRCARVSRVRVWEAAIFQSLRKPVIVFDCPLDSTQLGRFRRARICV